MIKDKYNLGPGLKTGSFTKGFEQVRKSMKAFQATQRIKVSAALSGLKVKDKREE